MSLVLIATGAPTASADTEPNNEQRNANGPLFDGVRTSGDLFAGSDLDYLRFYARKGSRVRVSYSVTATEATQPTGVANAVDFRIADKQGRQLENAGAYQIGAGQSGSIDYPAPTSGTYFVEVSVSPGFRDIETPIPYEITAAGVVPYDPVACDRRAASHRRAVRSLNRARRAVRAAKRRGQPTRAAKQRLARLERQRRAALRARERACSQGS